MEIQYGNIFVRRFSVMPGKAMLGDLHYFDHMTHLDVGEGDWLTHEQDQNGEWQLTGRTHHKALSVYGNDIIVRDGIFYEIHDKSADGLLTYKPLNDSLQMVQRISEFIDLDCKLIRANCAHSFYADVPSVLSCTFSHYNVDGTLSQTFTGNTKAYGSRKAIGLVR